VMSHGQDRPTDAPVVEAKLLRAFARVGDLGATGQASVPGAYAWSVTVAPVAFAHGAPSFAGVVAACGMAALVGAPILERSRPKPAQLLSVWGLVSTSLVVWVAVPSLSLSPLRIDVIRGFAGMLGWAFFALASATPATARPSSELALPASSRALQPRARAAGRGDMAILWIGLGSACVTQAVGWRVAEPERGVLVRLLGLACGLAAVSVADTIVAARHGARRIASPGRRARRALVPLIALGVLAGGALVVTLALPR
jgi:hypothetical protein